jgi:hypothetical protein
MYFSISKTSLSAVVARRKFAFRKFSDLPFWQLDFLCHLSLFATTPRCAFRNLQFNQITNDEEMWLDRKNLQTHNQALDTRRSPVPPPLTTRRTTRPTRSRRHHQRHENRPALSYFSKKTERSEPTTAAQQLIPRAIRAACEQMRARSEHQRADAIHHAGRSEPRSEPKRANPPRFGKQIPNPVNRCPFHRSVLFRQKKFLLLVLSALSPQSSKRPKPSAFSTFWPPKIQIAHAARICYLDSVMILDNRFSSGFYWAYFSPCSLCVGLSS